MNNPNTNNTALVNLSTFLRKLCIPIFAVCVCVCGARRGVARRGAVPARWSESCVARGTPPRSRCVHSVGGKLLGAAAFHSEIVEFDSWCKNSVRVLVLGNREKCPRCFQLIVFSLSYVEKPPWRRGAKRKQKYPFPVVSPPAQCQHPRGFFCIIPILTHSDPKGRSTHRTFARAHTHCRAGA